MTSTPFTLPPESPFGRFVLPLLAVTLGGLFLFSRVPQSPAVLTGVMGVVGIGYLPGLAFALWSERRFGLWASCILPLMVSPVLVTGAALALAWFGVSLRDAPSWLVMGSVIAILFAPLPRREIEDREVSTDMPGLIRRRSDRQQVLLLALGILALAAIPVLLAPWLRHSGNAAYQLAVLREVLSGIPPRDPLLAGFPLREFWAFHVYLGMMAETTRAGDGLLLAGGGLVAAFTMVFACYRLLTLLALRHVRALWGVVFLFFSLGGGFWLVRFFPEGYDAGVGALPPLFPAHLPESAGIIAGFPGVAAMFLEPFLNAGPAAIALSYLVLFLMAALAGLAEGRESRNLLAGLAALGMLLFHSGIAGVVLLTTVLAIPSIWIVSGLNPFRAPGNRLLALLAPIGAALAAASPYLRILLAKGGLSPSAILDVSWHRSAALLGAVAPELVLALWVLGAFLGSSNLRRQAWVVWSVMFLAVTQFLAFPGPRPLQLSVVLLHIPLALTAGTLVPGLWSRSPRFLRPAAVLLVAAILVPRTALGEWAYLETRHRLVVPVEAEAVVSWLRRDTPVEALVADTDPMLGLAAHRSMLLGSRDHLAAKGYSGNPVTARSLALFSLLRGKPVEGNRRESLLFPGAPVFVVRRTAEGALLPPPPESRLAYEDGAYRVYFWEPSGKAP